MSEEIRIIIVDDHPIVRKGLRDVISTERNLKVVAEAGDGESALALVLELQPHIAVLDIDMPKKGGFAVLRELKRRSVAVEVIFLTFHNEADILHKALNEGAKGYLLKESALIDIVQALWSVALGRPFISSAMTAELLGRQEQIQSLHRESPGLATLTVSERRVLERIANGKATKEIADELGVQPRTIESHRASICQKLGLNGTNSLLRFVLEHKLELGS